MSTPPPSTPVEVFCAFAQPDLASCLQLERFLKSAQRQQVLTLWHEGLIAVGKDRRETIETHFTSATLILLLISPDFLASDDCDALAQRALERHTAGEAHVIPILLRPAALQGTPLAGLAPLPTNLRPISRWRDKDAAFADVVAGIRRTIDDLDQLALKQAEQGLSRRSQQVWTIPYPRNPLFTGREDILAQLAATFRPWQQTWQRQALSGLGGVGKTQLAIEYAFRHRADYQVVLWARAENREDLTTSLLALAEALHLPESRQHDATLTLQALTRWLTREHGWLLILDNADDLDLVGKFLPPTLGGHLLLTTRAQSMGRLAHKLDIDPFTPELGAQFLLRRATILAQDAPLEQASPQDRTLALQLTHDLGGLPLALDQAGAYLEETGCTLSTYQQLYRRHRPKLLAERRGRISDHPKPVATTWSLAFERLQADQPAAVDLLRLCTCLSPDAIPEELLTEGASHLGDQLSSVAADPLLLNAAIESLRAYSLLGRSRATQTLSIHRLVQAVLEDSMDEPTHTLWAQRAVRVVNAAFPHIEFANWPQCQRLLPQALACAEHIEHRQMTFPEAARLLNQTAYYLGEQSRYPEAEPLYQRALAIWEQQLGPDHPDTATSLNNLALLYATQGKYEQAEPLYQRALAIREQHLGPDHPDTATSLNNLAALYRTQGKYEQAEPLYQRALAIREQQLGPTHPDTATSLNNLAALYRTQGKYEQAEPLYQRALAIWEQQLGPDHPDTATSLNNLALLYDTQGKYEQAEPLYQRALAIREQQLGPDHPDTATSLNNLALLYDTQGKYEQAEPLYQRALAIREQQLGPTHPDTATSLNNLAALYDTQGKYEQAEPLYQRALAIWEQQLGPDHPDTATSLNNLALLYATQGKYEQAEPLYQRALAIREQQLGPTHPDTATSLNNLAALYDTQGKYEQAEPLYQRALAIWEQQLGPDHPDTATSLNNLALLYATQGKYEQAEPLYQRALAIREQHLGPDHPDTATSLNNLAALYRTQGKYEQAEPLYQRALAIWEQQLGPDHPDTASSLNNLAALYRTQGKYEQAEPLYQRALAIREQHLGPDHPDTATSLNNLAALSYAQGKYEQAEVFHRRALTIREQQLGPKHPDTAQSIWWLAVLSEQQGNYEQAKPLYQRALAIYKERLGPKHPTTRTIQSNYEALLRAMGKRLG